LYRTTKKFFHICEKRDSNLSTSDIIVGSGLLRLYYMRARFFGKFGRKGRLEDVRKDEKIILKRMLTTLLLSELNSLKVDPLAAFVSTVTRFGVS
jgi:hypothetical protein